MRDTEKTIEKSYQSGQVFGELIMGTLAKIGRKTIIISITVICSTIFFVLGFLYFKRKKEMH